MSDPKTAKGEGEDAYHSGEEETSNPYPPGTDEHLSWNDGWLSAQEDEDRAQEEED